MQLWPFAPDRAGLNVQKTALDCTNTWEANTDLHRDGGSHNHQCIPTKATVGKAGSLQPPSIEPPPSIPPSAIVNPSEESCVRPHGRW